MTDYVINTYMGHPSYWTVGGGLYFSIYDLGILQAGLGSPMPAALRRNGWGLVPVVVALCDRSWLRACCSGFLRDG
jgi:hypothetical protein